MREQCEKEEFHRGITLIAKENLWALVLGNNKGK